MMEDVGCASPKYGDLIDKHKQRVCIEGYAYLNSTDFDRDSEDIYNEMQRTIDSSEDATLAVVFETWKKTNTRREEEMMTNIEGFCARHEFSRGAFLVGAAHRRRILEIADMRTGMRCDILSFDS